MERFLCYGTALSDIDLLAQTALTYADLSDCRFTELDVSHNSALERLIAYGNCLTALDVSRNPQLDMLDFDQTDIDGYSPEQIEQYSMKPNRRAVTVTAQGELALSALGEGFDASRASNWTNAAVSGDVLTVAAGATTVTYDYDIGRTVDGRSTRQAILDITWEQPTDPDEPVDPDPNPNPDPTEPTAGDREAGGDGCHSQ